MIWWPDYEIELRRLAKKHGIDPDTDEQWVRSLAWTLAVENDSEFGKRVKVPPEGMRRGSLLSGGPVVKRPLARGERIAPRKLPAPTRAALLEALRVLPLSALRTVHAAATKLADTKAIVGSTRLLTNWINTHGGVALLAEAKAGRSKKVCK